MKKELVCIVCPMGCSLVAEYENGKVLSVSGNTCPRGKAYAENECINPKRTVTTTVKCSDGSLIPVKTKDAIPKEKIFECMEIINKTITDLPICSGDVIIKDIYGTDIISCVNRG